MKNEFEGFVLAGGKSSRMGTDKAFLKIGGETFLERAIRNLQPACDHRVSVILNKNQNHFAENVSLKASYFFDIFQERGAVGAIHTALKNCASEFAIILAVDMPLIDGKIVEKLALKARISKNISAVVPIQINQRLQPLCAVYRVCECLPVIENLLNANASASVKEFLKLVNVEFVKSESLFDGEVNSFSNINTSLEYKNFIENL